jgi:hypothetical protein
VIAAISATCPSMNALGIGSFMTLAGDVVEKAFALPQHAAMAARKMHAGAARTTDSVAMLISGANARGFRAARSCAPIAAASIVQD